MRRVFTKSFNLFHFALGCMTILLWPGIVFSQGVSEGGGLSDHPLMSGFPDSEIVEVSFEEDVNYTLVLSSLQRTRGAVVADASERIRADVTRILYEVSQDFTGADVLEFFREQMNERAYTELFSCEGRNCGNSNYWANDIFRNRILYGPERNQFYVAMRGNLGLEVEPSIALYIATRSNRRIYAYLEFIEPGGGVPVTILVEPEDLLNQLNEDGAVVLPAIAFDDEDQLTANSDLDYLVQLFEIDDQLRVHLVSHLSGSGPLEMLLERSRVRAELVRQRLLEGGVSPERISAQGVGPLAPLCNGSNCRERIELVLQ